MKKTKITESKCSRVSKLAKATYKERNQFSNNNGFKDLRSLVYRSLELDTNSGFNDSTNSSEISSDSTISDSCIPAKRTEAIDLPSVSSSYENNLNSSFSISMPYISDQSNLNFSLIYVDHTLFDVKELENMLDHDSGVFVSTKCNSLNLSEISNSDNDENSKDSLFCVIDEDKKTCPSNFLLQGKTLNTKGNILLPESLKGKGKKHNCPHCLKSFGMPSRLKRHIKTHKIIPNDSEDDEGTTSLGSNSINEESVDLDSERSICEKRQNVLHKQKDAQCPNCLKSFKCPSKLLRHIKTHVGLKSYTCPLCSKAFLGEYNLNAHIRIHRNEQPYICKKCERAFNVKSNLNRHIRSHIREDQFTCSKCGKGCSSEKKLAIHFRSHDKIPHKCPQCGKEFNKKANLNRHIKIHSDEKEHSCNFCDYRAGQVSHLERHIQRKHAK